MVDYKKDTGSSGTMMIRDNGTVVEFFINSNNSSTFNNQLPWGYTVNGKTDNSNTYKYSAGAGWERLGYWSITTSQTVTFRLGDTGTSGFGGPTSFSVAIKRAKAPSAPSTPTASGLTHNSVTISFTDGANNGASITQRQIARNTSNTTSGASTFSSDGSTAFTGLAQGTAYYFWARTYNSEGWSPWSGVRGITTYRVPDMPDSAIVSDIDQTSFWVSFTGNGNGGMPILEWRVYWNTQANENGIQSVEYQNSTPMRITGLQPATSYFVWTRGRNAAGWGPYSQWVQITTIAGASVLVGSTWKQAIPYVNVNGVWKLARPWSRVAGVWKETT
jgi:hypothetical protein